MITKILVPLDGSPLSESVFPWLRLLASSLTPTVQVELVRCFQPVSSVYFLPELAIAPTSYLSIEALQQMMLDYLEKKKAELEGLQVTVSAVVDEPSNGILAKSETCDLVLLASRGAGGLRRWILGSVASKVAQGSTRPILVVNAQETQRPAKVERILVAVDGSPTAERAFVMAGELARQLGSKVLLYQAVGQAEVIHKSIDELNRQQLKSAEAYLQKLAASVDGLEGLETEVRGVWGDTAIVKVAEEKDIDLLVMGCRGRSGLERWILGSQTERVLRHAPCPVLIVP